MTPRRVREMLGSAGARALAAAETALAERHPDAPDRTLTWATWTAHEWNFTFAELAPPARLVIHVPNDSGPVIIDRLRPSNRPGAGPLSDLGGE